MIATAKITANGQVTIPKIIRDQKGLTAGMVVQFTFHSGQVLLDPLVSYTPAKKIKTKQEALEWLHNLAESTPMLTEEEEAAIMQEAIAEIKKYRHECDN